MTARTKWGLLLCAQAFFVLDHLNARIGITWEFAALACGALILATSAVRARLALRKERRKDREPLA